MTTGLKPSWQGLKAPMQFNNPVEEVVGQFVDWRLEPDAFMNNQIIFRLSSCQIINSDVPYPYPDWEMAIKFSEHEVSAWGFFGVSVAEALGMDINLLDIDLLKGRWAHIFRTPHDYGPNKEKEISPGVPARMIGQVYRIVRIIQPGETVASVKPAPTQAMATPAIATGGVVLAPTPTQVAMPAAQVMGTVPAVQPPLMPNGALSTPEALAVSEVVGAPADTLPWEAPVVPVQATAEPPVSDQTPEQRALELLHGKDMASFFQVAIPDPIIRTDAGLVNAIMSGVFVQTKITSGQVLLNVDGSHTVV